MFTPQQEYAGLLMSGAEDKLKRLIDEIRRELEHVERMMCDSATSLKDRKATLHLVSLLGNLPAAIQSSGWDLSRAARELEESVQKIHDEVMNLDPNW